MAVMDYMKKKGAGILLGAVFVLSGFVKAVDPVGFSYKIEEYLRMFGGTEWHGAAIAFAVVLCAAEMILGLLLLSGLWRRLAAVAAFLFVSGFTVLTYVIYADPYGGINECGCFGEAIHLSNGATLAKNVFLLLVAGVNLWQAFRAERCGFEVWQAGLTAGIVVLAFAVPLYACFYLPPFDFLPYGVGSKVERGGDLRWYDAGFNDVTEKMFAEGKPVYMVGMRSAMPSEAVERMAALYEAYCSGEIVLFAAASESGLTFPGGGDVPVCFMDGMVLKSLLRSRVGVVAFTAEGRIAGKWNLLHTPYRFTGRYGNELCGERRKQVVFFGVLAVMLFLLFYGRKKLVK